MHDIPLCFRRFLAAKRRGGADEEIYEFPVSRPLSLAMARREEIHAASTNE